MVWHVLYNWKMFNPLLKIIIISVRVNNHLTKYDRHGSVPVDGFGEEEYLEDDEDEDDGGRGHQHGNNPRLL